MRCKRLFICLSTGFLLAGFLACSRVSSPPSVLIVMIDTLRYDYLGCYGFEGPISPNIDALASESLVFTKCYAPAPWTKPSIASLSTSLYPTNHGVTNHDGRWWGEGSEDLVKGVLGDSAYTMAEMLSASGYQTAGFVANPWITAEYGFAQGFEVFDTQGFYPPASDVLARTGTWFETRDRERPFFLYLHLMDVHGPYDAPESDFAPLAGSGSVADDRILERSEWEAIPEYLRKPAWARSKTGRKVETWKGRYAAGVRSLDHALGEFLMDLRDSGVLDGTWLIVTSDHGEELADHGGWNHGTTLYEEMIRVPLIVRPPGGLEGGRVYEDLVSLLDLYPTLADLAGGECPPEIVGESLVPALEERSTGSPRVLLAMATTEGPELVAIRAAGYKIIRNREDESSLLFDVDADPRETRELSGSRPDAARQLETRLSRELADIRNAGLFEPASRPPSEETRELLESLGYAN